MSIWTDIVNTPTATLCPPQIPQTGMDFEMNLDIMSLFDQTCLGLTPLEMNLETTSADGVLGIGDGWDIDSGVAEQVGGTE